MEREPDNGVPLDGARAFGEGWSDKACPFSAGPARDKWLTDWAAAAAQGWQAWLDGGSGPTNG